MGTIQFRTCHLTQKKKKTQPRHFTRLAVTCHAWPNLPWYGIISHDVAWYEASYGVCMTWLRAHFFLLSGTRTVWFGLQVVWHGIPQPAAPFPFRTTINKRERLWSVCWLLRTAAARMIYPRVLVWVCFSSNRTLGPVLLWPSAIRYLQVSG